METQDTTLAYTLARIGMGINLGLHGLVRIPKLSAFAESMTQSFEKSWLPSPLTNAFAHALPFAELIIGVLLLLGLLTRYATIAGAATIIALIFGSCLIENWGAAGSQMVYLAYLSVLLAFRAKLNQLSIDNMLR